MSDLKADLFEFNNFYNRNDCAPYSKIERPQNPFDKNFEINRKGMKSSLSELDDFKTKLKPERKSLLNLCPVE